jgi:hypothetical protein
MPGCRKAQRPTSRCQNVAGVASIDMTAARIIAELVTAMVRRGGLAALVDPGTLVEVGELAVSCVGCR